MAAIKQGLEAIAAKGAQVRLMGEGENGGQWIITIPGGSKIMLRASWGGGWDHVSASTPTRCLTWTEMDAVKSLFWSEHEVVMQLHVPETLKVNVHPFCLHLWRPQRERIPLPPKVFV